MRHMLMNPAFPDIVGAWALRNLNDNDPLTEEPTDSEEAHKGPFDPQSLTWLGDPRPATNCPAMNQASATSDRGWECLLDAIAFARVAATRLW